MLSILVVAVFYVIAAYAQVAGFGFDLATFLRRRRSPRPRCSRSVAGLGRGLRLGPMLKVLLLVVLLDVMAVGLGAGDGVDAGLFALARDRKIPARSRARPRAAEPDRGRTRRR